MFRQPKRQKKLSNATTNLDYIDRLPDDLVITILSKLSSSASSPSDFFTVLLTCKRLNKLALNPLVISKAGLHVFSVKAKSWSENSHRFLKYACHVGNPEACYTLGMIRFYCLQSKGNGLSLMARAAIKSHALALYSLAVIQFNGSGGPTKNDKNLRSAVALCARAASLGHNDALRELGHCLQDGYGVNKNITDGRRLLFQANTRELAMSLCCSHHELCHVTVPDQLKNYSGQTGFNKSSGQNVRLESGCLLLSDYGCNVPLPKIHPVNVFMKEWYDSGKGVELGKGLSFCSYVGCGRPEFRIREFRRCSICSKVRYCSRGCQALDWKLKHKLECTIVAIDHVNEGGVEEIVGNVDVANEINE
ncbi:hypothetical protein ACFE04_028096 [Oxalis oulophora]